MPSVEKCKAKRIIGSILLAGKEEVGWKFSAFAYQKIEGKEP